ncbi:hypothetical protein [Actinophytocola algeriensis]|uniref:Uncharacterized protein n=1 Tax=Actinophytocola algeriensis TaxID=1768010 RepID=A0A7W7Q2G5_9PSEU|nr:hypothetical protein [Actinophytocola algeriensis]MBB4905755.1 hypothetical protein [Actinophytocola algeriensis]MBE1472560.1 hypothetical protein [Actinophytocola algeriensis]
MTTATALSLDGMYLIPPEHHVPDTDRATAAELLGCDDRAIDALVHDGLTVSGDRFDGRDLFNLGLHSGTGRTVPEQAFAFSLRWMRASADALLSPRTLGFTLTADCACADVTLAVPRPDRYGGAVTPAPSRDVVRASTVTATIRTEGRAAPLRSPVLRGLVEEFAGLGVRWVKLPDALRDDETLVTSHRVATCESASRWLALRCRAAGYAATTRIGWVVGMLDLVHAWVEVTDDDGETKIVDPVFALFAAGVAGANPLLTDPAVALRTNRLVPTALEVGGRVAHHGCDLPVTVRINPVKEMS